MHNIFSQAVSVLHQNEGGIGKSITDAQIGCPTNAVSLSRFLLEEIIQKAPSYGIYHFTDGEVMSWYGFAQQILGEYGLENSTKLVADKNYCTFVERPKNSELKSQF